MTIKSTKYLALALAIVMALLTLYTLDIGLRLWSYTSTVGYAQECCGRAKADQAYIEMTAKRMKLANETSYANFLYYSGNAVRLLVFGIEVVAVYVSVTLYRALCLLEELQKRKELKMKRMKVREGK